MRLPPESGPRADAGPGRALQQRSLHQPVLLEPCLEHLGLRQRGERAGRSDRPLVVGGTLGDGGHAQAILERTAPDGRLIGLDLDPEALAIAGERLASFGERAELVHASFRDLADVLSGLGVTAVDAVLLDLGVSSRQIDDPRRGFRFAEDTADVCALDMRMDPSAGPAAAELLASYSSPALEQVLREYGEVPGARRLARAITEARREAPLRTAGDLRQVIRRSGIGRGRKHDPATLVFQALRIAVNDELCALDDGLAAAVDALAAGGRICVLAYHSLEDRRVKRCFVTEEKGCVCPPAQPVCNCGRLPRLRRLTKRPLSAEPEEIVHNPRARSARLRAAERLPEAV